jgi:phenylalanyl-tRNA synthetase alpha chain
MQDQILAVKQAAASFEVQNEEQLEAFRLRFLSRNGEVGAMFKLMKDFKPEERKAAGQLMNEVKVYVEERYKSLEENIKSNATTLTGGVDDPTLVVGPQARGGLHPLTTMLDEIKKIFFRLGFTVSDGPELEDDFHNFTALNFPPEHPARDEQDTFFVRKSKENEESDLVLRTHTSPVQIRQMLKQEPPIRSIMPGRVYRNEAVTYKSYFLFHQVEGLYIDKGVTMAELKETLITFAKMMYGSSVKYRMRPSFFPFTEPSLEMDIWWEQAKGGGRWLEILGAGMVDPNVLKSVDLDPETYSGFAFGMGIERSAMLHYGIDDIRLFYENDLRFLSQFN